MTSYLPLALLVTRVVADDHDNGVPPDHLALIADRLDAGLDLHCSLLGLRPCGHVPWALDHDVVTGAPKSTHGRRRIFVELLVAVDDAAACEVVRRKLHDHAVFRQDANVVLAHLAADVGEHPVTVFQLHAKTRIRERFNDPALDLDDPVLLGHILRYLLADESPGASQDGTHRADDGRQPTADRRRNANGAPHGTTTGIEPQWMQHENRHDHARQRFTVLVFAAICQSRLACTTRTPGNQSGELSWVNLSG